MIQLELLTTRKLRKSSLCLHCLVAMQKLQPIWVADTDYFFKPRRRSRSLRRARRFSDTTFRNSPVSICMLAASFRSRAASLSASIRSGPQGSARAFANASSAIDQRRSSSTITTSKLKPRGLGPWQFRLPD